jgi:predicted nucleic acid-binding protein
LTNVGTPLVIDTSVAINLIATGCAERIVGALPNDFAITDVARDELESGRFNGRRDADVVQALISGGLIRVVSLDEPADSVFEKLVIGNARWTLDDGEAATIAYGAMQKAIPVIDERKATRVASEFFPDLPLCNSVDLLSHPAVLESLGPARLAEAVGSALLVARMRVLPTHLEWVLDIVGREQAGQYPSLPRSARARSNRSAMPTG